MNRSISLIVAASLAGVAMPALAQDNRYASVQEELAAQQAEAAADEAQAAMEYQRADDEAESVADAASYSPDHNNDPVEYYDEEPADHRADNRHPPRPNGYHDARHTDGRTDGQPRLGYSMDEREAWLSQCRYQYSAYYDDGRGDDSGLIGGILGAIVGGVGGNRIGGRGDRLAGTLIGAGVGGIAGAVIGSAIGNGNRDDDHYDRALDECEAYLLRYERSALSGGGYGQSYAPVAYAPVMMVRVPIQRTRHVHNEDCYEVVEEWVDEAPAPRAARTARRAPARVRAPTKLRSIK